MSTQSETDSIINCHLLGGFVYLCSVFVFLFINGFLRIRILEPIRKHKKN